MVYYAAWACLQARFFFIFYVHEVPAFVSHDAWALCFQVIRIHPLSESKRRVFVWECSMALRLQGARDGGRLT
jgi:hypothetical protein